MTNPQPLMFDLKNLENKFNLCFGSPRDLFKIGQLVNLGNPVPLDFLYHSELKISSNLMYPIFHQFDYSGQIHSSLIGNAYLRTSLQENSSYAESLIIDFEKPVKTNPSTILPRCQIKAFRELGSEDCSPICAREDYGYVFGLFKKYSDFRGALPSGWFFPEFPEDDVFNLALD